MKRFVIVCLIIEIVLLISCSSSTDLPKEGESLVLIYVEEIHKPLNAPKVELHIEGIEQPLRFTVKAPSTTAAMDTIGNFVTSGWSATGNTTLNVPENFEFSLLEGTVTLLPYKITLVSKSQIEIRRLTDLDLDFAKSAFAMNEKLQNLEIIYPELIQD